ncbi:MAG: hypothetical protein P4L53_11675 [Candidatus Obscuribacterales bacterium]|nr:hypothetical protein [Candidatus Obscuribacterales bacterium]
MTELFEKRLTYRDWIRQFKSDDSPFGELSREVWIHSAPAGVNDYFQWRQFLQSTGSELQDALKESFRRYLVNEEPNLPNAQVVLVFDNAHGVSEDVAYSLKSLDSLPDDQDSNKRQEFTLFGFLPQYMRKLEALKRQSTEILFKIEYIDRDEDETFSGIITSVLLETVSRLKVIKFRTLQSS